MEHKKHIQSAIDYIENNLCKTITLDEIAQKSYFSEFHFHRLFRKIVGTSVMDYVRRRRLCEAAKELVGTNVKITNIAFKYQFSSEEAFSRAFKKNYGSSPRDYRNTRNKLDDTRNESRFIQPLASSSINTVRRAA